MGDFVFVTSAILRLICDSVVTGGGNRITQRIHGLAPSHWQLFHIGQQYG